MKKIQIALLALLALSLADYAGQDRKCLKVKVPTANVRYSADVTGPAVFPVKLGEQLEYRAKVGDWYEVVLFPDDGSIVGYIDASAVDIVVIKITEQMKYETAERQINNKIAGSIGDYVLEGLSFPAIVTPEDCLLKKESLIYRLLVPKYAKNLPLADPWGEPYEIYFGNNAWGKVYFEYFGIQEIVVSDFLVVSKGKLGAHEIWKYDPKSPETGLYPEFDAKKNIINYNGKLIRGIKK